MCHMSHVMCHVIRDMWYTSHVMCHVICDMCHMTHVTCHMSDKLMELVGGGSVINGAYPF